MNTILDDEFVKKENNKWLNFKNGTKDLLRVAKIECVIFLILYITLLASFFLSTNQTDSIKMISKIVFIVIFIGIEVIFVKSKGDSKKLVFATLVWVNIFTTTSLIFVLLNFF